MHSYKIIFPPFYGSLYSYRIKQIEIVTEFEVFLQPSGTISAWEAAGEKSANAFPVFLASAPFWPTPPEVSPTCVRPALRSLMNYNCGRETSKPKANIDGTCRVGPLLDVSNEYLCLAACSVFT